MKELKFSPFRKRLIYALKIDEHYKNKTGKETQKKVAESPKKEETQTFPTDTYKQTFRKHRKSLFKEQIVLPDENESLPEEFSKYDHELLTTSFIDFETFVEILRPLSKYGSKEEKLKCNKHISRNLYSSDVQNFRH
jgi:hypothetical protein